LTCCCQPFAVSRLRRRRMPSLPQSAEHRSRPLERLDQPARFRGVSRSWSCRTIGAMVPCEARGPQVPDERNLDVDVADLARAHFL
jgi:hypothetical protein